MLTSETRKALTLYTYVGNNPIARFDADGHCWPLSDCVARFQNAVNEATDKVVRAAESSGSPSLAFAATALGGTTRDLVNGAADAFNAGSAIGACMDSCNGVQMADAVGQDLGRTSALVSYAAAGAAGGQAVGSRMQSPAAPAPVPTPAAPQARFVVTEGGTAVPTSQAEMISSLRKVGTPEAPVTNPAGARIGTQFELPNGVRARAMDPSGAAPRRTSFSNANGQPVTPEGRVPQPPRNSTTAEAKAFVRQRTHVEQKQ